MAVCLGPPRFQRVAQLYRKRSYTSISRLPLAFDLHEPAKKSTTAPSAIIFMHGLFGSKKNNRSISKALARDLGRPIYAVDLRNHGDSPHDPKHDYLSMADDVASFIDDHGLTDTTLIGHSMGAKTAMTLALSDPSNVANIISVDNAPMSAALLGDFAKYIHGMRKVEESNVTRQVDADRILKDYEESLMIRQFLLGNLKRTDQRTQKFQVPLKILASSLDHLGEFPFTDLNEVRFEKPALFIRGTKSKYVPDEAIPVIGRFFPRFQLVDIDSGHWVISEQPEAFRKAIVEFLKPEE